MIKTLKEGWDYDNGNKHEKWQQGYQRDMFSSQMRAHCNGLIILVKNLLDQW